MRKIKKKLIITVSAFVVAGLFIGEFVYASHQASANGLKFRADSVASGQKNNKTITVSSKTQKSVNQPPSRKHSISKKRLEHLMMPKPEYANVNQFISAMANYYNHQHPSSLHETRLSKQETRATAVDEYVDYYSLKVKDKHKMKLLRKAQWAAENFIYTKKQKYLDELKKIFNQLNQH